MHEAGRFDGWGVTASWPERYDGAQVGGRGRMQAGRYALRGRRAGEARPHCCLYGPQAAALPQAKCVVPSTQTPLRGNHMTRRFLLLALLASFSAICMAKTPPPTYTIVTFKNGHEIGKRTVRIVDLHNAARALISAFNDRTPDFGLLVGVAKSMPAKDRCFNLFSSRVALASVQAGIFDTSANSEDFLNKSIRSIEEVNSQTQVTCDMK